MALINNLSHKIIYDVHNYVESNLHQQFRIKDLSDIAFLSYSRLRHLYEEITGEPVWQYIKRYRLEYAGGLLRHSNFSCSEIGEKVGYATRHSFCKAFTQQFGVSPGQFQHIERLPFDIMIERQVNEKIFDSLQDFQTLQDQGLLQPIKIANTTYCFKRVQVGSDEALLNLVHTLKQEYSGKKLVFSSPDVICMNISNNMRVNFGFFVEGSPDAVSDGYFKKKIFYQKYLVYQFRAPLPMLPLYIYKLIDAGKKKGYMSVPHHDGFVVVPPDKDAMEIWVPFV